MAIIKNVQLIFSDLSKNSYKTWKGELHDDGTVISKFSAVGGTEQECNYGQVGESFYDKKIKEKLRKGYSRAKTIETEPQTGAALSRQTLSEIAVNQIKHSNDAIKSLIRRLADSNVHKITSGTNIVFDKDSGLFQTPLGVVSQEGITEARDILTFFNDSPKFGAKYKKNIDSYLRLIPRRKGQTLRYESIFPTLDEVKKESDVLDALENSLSLLNKPQKGSSAPTAVEQVFKLKFDVLNEPSERTRVSDWFYKSKKAMHHYDNVKIREIYLVDIEEYNQQFNEKLGNIQEVWHGSSEANILSILKSGIKVRPPSSAKIAGKLFGEGAYGSKTSSKSLGYTFSRWGQSSGDAGWVFCCDFAMGKAFEPTTYGISSVPTGYDSCFADPKKTGLNNDEYIVYSEKQVKIKYLLEVK